MKRILSLLIILTFFLLVAGYKVTVVKRVNKTKIVGVVSLISGKAMIKRAGTKNWESLKLKTRVSKNDLIERL